MSFCINSILTRITPRRARAAVLAYGITMQFNVEKYKYRRWHNSINYRSFYKAFFHPEESVWVTLLTPSEMLHALGLTPLVLEAVGGVIGSLNLAGSLLKNSAEIGVPSSLCTFHRAHLSVVLKNGFYAPGSIVAASSLCDGNLRSMQAIGKLTGAPFYFIDVPEPGAQDAESYVADQLEELFFRLARSTQNHDKIKDPLSHLKKAVSLAEETRKIMKKINELRQEKYFPDLPPMALAWNLLNHTAQLGSTGSLKFYTILYKELLQKGKPIPPEKLRFLLMHLPPVYNNPALDVIKKKNGAVIIEEYNDIPWPQMNPDEPFKSIAGKILSLPQLGTPLRRINQINSMIKKYSVDGIISFSHWGCRQSSGSINAMKPLFQKPVLNIETDLVDRDSSSSGQTLTRIESFIEILENRQQSNFSSKD
ncbi:MAG: 2-hydroxyacyl-CoA dehydratase family protein [Spirochaetota bacterium]